MFIFLQLSTHCPHPPKGRIQGKRSQLCTVSRCTLGSTRTSPPAAHILNQSGSKSHKTRSTLWSLIEIFNPNFHRVSLPTINPYLPKPLQSLVKANSFRDRQTRSTDCRISMEWIRATGTWCTPQGRAVNEPREFLRKDRPPSELEGINNFGSLRSFAFQNCPTLFPSVYKNNKGYNLPTVFSNPHSNSIRKYSCLTCLVLCHELLVSTVMTAMPA
ncbi:hypothetical protein CPB86DRAFT_401919 [Serendipita vermifera]|nr:hypothetical protein CPB86DRAFT_401919 [Serendipita vermifera]